jgi:hypothetical protein
MRKKLPVGVTESPSELKDRIEAERVGIPFPLYRDGAGRQRILTLGEAGQFAMGRASTTDVRLDWDSEVLGVACGAGAVRHALDRVG